MDGDEQRLALLQLPQQFKVFSKEAPKQHGRFFNTIHSPWNHTGFSTAIKCDV